MADSKTVYDFSSVLNVETDDDSTIEPLEIEQQLAKEERVYDFSSVLEAKEVDLDEISTARQLGYGFEQEPQLLGTAYRGAKAVGRSPPARSSTLDIDSPLRMRYSPGNLTSPFSVTESSGFQSGRARTCK